MKQAINISISVEFECPDSAGIRESADAVAERVLSDVLAHTHTIENGIRITDARLEDHTADLSDENILTEAKQCLSKDTIITEAGATGKQPMSFLLYWLNANYGLPITKCFMLAKDILKYFNVKE